MIPEPGKPASEFQVHHEAIDTFVGRDGRLVGMSAMVMPFPLGEGVSLDGIAPGDIVEVTFEVNWESDPYFQVTRLTELPPETALVFGKTKPPAGLP